MTKVLTKLGILVAGILLLPSLASAQYRAEPGWMVDNFADRAGQLWAIAPAYGGPQAEEGGAGHEQSRAAYRMLADGAIEVGVIYMSSNLENDGDRPWQCKISVLRLDTSGISLVHDQVQVTAGNGNGDRPCGHPTIASSQDQRYWIIAYGRDATNGNTQPYMEFRDVLTLERVGNRQNLTQNNNNNVGAPVVKDYGTHIYTAFYDNDANRTYGRTFAWDDAALTISALTDQTTIVTPADIGRPSGIQDVGPGAALICAAQGDNRPPEDGIYCRVMNTLDNTTIFQGRVYDADPGNNMYYNMPYTADLGNGYFAISAQRSNGAGKNNNNKGAALGMVKIFKWDGIDLIEMGEYNDIGGLATHLSLTNSVVTLDGVTKNRMTFLGSPITGSGPASLTFLSFDELTNVVAFDKQRVAHAYNSDSGKISNIYGENPNDQGRDFHTVLGNVPNPSYGLPSGYMPEVQSFMVITTHGRNAGDPKNGMHLRFLPSQTDLAGVDDDCVINPATCETPPPPDDPVDVDPDDDGDSNPAPGDWGSPQSGNPSLLGCHVGTGRAAGGSALLLLGLALLVIRRRR